MCPQSTPVSYDIHIEMYNINSRGKKDYLSVGETQLETVFWVSTAAPCIGCLHGACMPRAHAP